MLNAAQLVVYLYKPLTFLITLVTTKFRLVIDVRCKMLKRY